MTPLGGTELQHNFLGQFVDKKLLEAVNICTSVPEKIPLSESKINILWQKNAPNQPNIQPWFANKDIIKSMIGMYLTVVGIMKNTETLLVYQQINVML